MAYENITTIMGLWQETNVVTDYFFTYLFLLMVFLIVAVSMSQFDKKHVFITATTINTVVAMFLFIGGLLPQQALVISIILWVVAVFVNIFVRD